MYCSNCGKHNPEDSKFCQFCGAKLASRKVPVHTAKVNKSESNEITVSGEQLEKLQKRYKNTANTSMALSIFSLFATFIVSLEKYSFTESLVGAIIFIPFLIPFYYYGQRLKKIGTENLKSSLKITKGMLIYTVLFCIVNLAMGGLGFLWFILLYYYFKAYQETKKVFKQAES